MKKEVYYTVHVGGRSFAVALPFYGVQEDNKHFIRILPNGKVHTLELKEHDLNLFQWCDAPTSENDDSDRPLYDGAASACVAEYSECTADDWLNAIEKAQIILNKYKP